MTSEKLQALAADAYVSTLDDITEESQQTVVLEGASLRGVASGRLFPVLGEPYIFSAAHLLPPNILGDDPLLLERVELPRAALDGAAMPVSLAARLGSVASESLPDRFSHASRQLLSLAGLISGEGLERDGYRFETLSPGRIEWTECGVEAIAASSSAELLGAGFQREYLDRPIFQGDFELRIHGRKFAVLRGLRLALEPCRDLVDRILHGHENEELTASLKEYLEAAQNHPSSLPNPEMDTLGVLRWSLGCAALAWGGKYEKYPENRRYMRPPCPPILMFHRALSVEGTPRDELKAGSFSQLEYLMPKDPWFLKGSEATSMPYALALEAAVQSPVFAAGHMGLDACFNESSYVRNLDGRCTEYRPIEKSSARLRSTVKVKKVVNLSDVVLTTFEIELFADEQLHMKVETVFGMFNKRGLERSSGVPQSDAIKSRLEGMQLLPAIVLKDQPEKFFGGRGALADNLMRMVEELRVSPAEDGGDQVWLLGTKTVDPSDWYFKSHFFQDPVMPGSFGAEACLQTIHAYLLERGLAKKSDPVEPVAYTPPGGFVFKYRGMINCDDRKMQVLIRIKDISVDPETGDTICLTDSTIWKRDGFCIYEFKDLGMRVRANPRPATERHPEAKPEETMEFDRSQLEMLAQGQVEALFGPEFAELQQRKIKMRIPAPPLLLVDRVSELRLKPNPKDGGFCKGYVDLSPDKWYLRQDGNIPIGILAESSQAVLVLLSRMGVDFLYDPKQPRVFRMLSSEIRLLEDMPRLGDKLRLEMEVAPIKNEGGIWHGSFDCVWHAGERVVLKVHSRGGLFTYDELRGSRGILWDAEKLFPRMKFDPPASGAPVPASITKLDATAVAALAAGRLTQSFGEGFASVAGHRDTPKIYSGMLGLIHRVVDFQPSGGPWGRGYLRAETDVSPEHWYFKAHFVNDPCMPGYVMLEACAQAVKVYMMAQGLTVDCDEHKFQVVPGSTLRINCRGQVWPDSKKIEYHVHVQSLRPGPRPSVKATVLAVCDGMKVFLAEDIEMGLFPKR